MSEVEWWGGDSVGQDMGVQGRAGHVGWPQAGGKDMAELLQDSQGPWGLVPVGVLGPWGLVPTGILGQLVPTGMQDAALMGTGPHTGMLSLWLAESCWDKGVLSPWGTGPH